MNTYYVFVMRLTNVISDALGVTPHIVKKILHLTYYINIIHIYSYYDSNNP